MCWHPRPLLSGCLHNSTVVHLFPLNVFVWETFKNRLLLQCQKYKVEEEDVFFIKCIPPQSSRRGGYVSDRIWFPFKSPACVSLLRQTGLLMDAADDGYQDGNNSDTRRETVKQMSPILLLWFWKTEMTPAASPTHSMPQTIFIVVPPFFREYKC